MENIFLTKLRENPGDLDEREVYADWLDDEGRHKEAEIWRFINKKRWIPSDEGWLSSFNDKDLREGPAWIPYKLAIEAFEVWGRSSRFASRGAYESGLERLVAVLMTYEENPFE